MFFFFNDTATTEIYTLSLHDALPISVADGLGRRAAPPGLGRDVGHHAAARRDLGALPDPDMPGCSGLDRKSTRLNSSHANISYAVFCLKKKKILLTSPRSLLSILIVL